jgi:hypothetical protein
MIPHISPEAKLELICCEITAEGAVMQRIIRAIQLEHTVFLPRSTHPSLIENQRTLHQWPIFRLQEQCAESAVFGTLPVVGG